VATDGSFTLKTDKNHILSNLNLLHIQRFHWKNIQHKMGWKKIH